MKYYSIQLTKKEIDRLKKALDSHMINNNNDNIIWEESSLLKKKLLKIETN